MVFLKSLVRRKEMKKIYIVSPLLLAE